MFDIVQEPPRVCSWPFRKTPVCTQKRKENQDPKKDILVLVIGIIIYWLGIVICVYSDCVYDIGRFIVYLVICIFLCWEWVRWVVYLVSVYLVLFCLGGNWLYTWFVYTEIPRVFWALGILFIYLLWCWERDTRSSGFWSISCRYGFISWMLYWAWNLEMVPFSSSIRVS